ncbi:hypothetical protein JCM8547_003687 [Rhodosporidiobolus lusitaniae]
MGFRDKPHTGGKKGPRQATSKRQPKITLRPAPPKSAPRPDGDSSFSADEQDEHYDEEDQDEDAGEADETYGYRQALKGEAKPLEGLNVSVSGCSGQKEDLLALADEYGAERHGGLQEDTTHLVTDKPEGAKYQMALARRMHVMQPSWLAAVREAWVEGEMVDWEELEDEHTMGPLFGVVASLTHFARGEHKDHFKFLLVRAGAVVQDKLDNTVTHLIVSSPLSPHSGTPSSEKLLHARRNRHKLHPDFQTVWEGWAREAVRYGGRRKERDEAWKWKEGGSEPEEDVSWAVENEAPRTGHLLKEGERFAPPSKAVPFERPNPTPFARPPQPAASRSLVVPQRGANRPSAFSGYDTSLLDTTLDTSTDASLSAQAAYDISNGKVLKKRRRAVPASASSFFPSASQQQNPLLGDDASSLLEVYGASQQALPIPPAHYADTSDSRFADASTSTSTSAGDISLHTFSTARARQRADESAEMALELVPGEVEMRYTKKSKSVIKALGKGREGSFAAPGEEGRKAVKTFGKRVEGEKGKEGEGAAADDSAFFSAPLSLPPSDDPPAPAPDAAVSAQNASSSPPRTGSPLQPFFANLKFAIVGLAAHGADPKKVKKEIELCGGSAVVDPDEGELEEVDYVCVHYRDPPSHLDLSDPRVVSVCWLELCFFYDRFIPVEDNVLERPIPYQCPVPGVEGLKFHFSGFGATNEPLMHHLKRYTHTIGAELSDSLTRTSTTHLIVFELGLPDGQAPSLDDLAKENLKVKKALEWDIPVYSLPRLKEEVRKLAEEVAAAKKGKTTKGEKGKMGEKEGKRERSVREITNELDERDRSRGGAEESMKGPLRNCVVFFSTKINVDRPHLAATVQDLDGYAAQSFSQAVTHLVHAGTKSSESFKEFKEAKKEGMAIVHPRWVEECGRTSSRVSEGAFPHTFDARKGGQLFDMGMEVSASPPMSRSNSRQPSRAPSRSPSRVSLGTGAGGRTSASPPQLQRQQASLSRSSSKRPLDLADHDEHGVPQPHSSSPSPRRRRSDTTATEVADEIASVLPSPPRRFSPSTSSSSPFPPAPALAAIPPSSASAHPSSDGLAALPSDFYKEDKEENQEEAGGPGRGQTQLRQQTSLLAQWMDAPLGAEEGKGKGGRKGSRTGLGRKKSSNASNHSGGGSTSLLSATTNPTSLSTSANPPRFGFPSEPTQQTQEDESLYVVYDDSAQAAAREQIRLALAAGAGESQGGGEGGSQGVWEDGMARRTRRSTRAAAAGRR